MKLCRYRHLDGKKDDLEMKKYIYQTVFEDVKIPGRGYHKIKDKYYTVEKLLRKFNSNQEQEARMELDKMLGSDRSDMGHMVSFEDYQDAFDTKYTGLVVMNTESAIK